MSQRQNRKPAKRVFACEFNDSTVVRKEGDGEYSPNMQVLRTGELANRVLMAGTLMSVNESEDGSSKTGVIVDPSGNVYPDSDGDSPQNMTSKVEEFRISGHKEYRTKAFSFLSEFEEDDRNAMYVGVVGKPNDYSPEDSDTTYVSVRPEMIREIDEAGRNEIICDILSETIERMNTFISQRNTENVNPSIEEAISNYGTDISRYRNGCLSAANNVIQG